MGLNGQGEKKYGLRPVLLAGASVPAGGVCGGGVITRRCSARSARAAQRCAWRSNDKDFSLVAGAAASVPGGQNAAIPTQKACWLRAFLSRWAAAAAAPGAVTARAAPAPPALRMRRRRCAAFTGVAHSGQRPVSAWWRSVFFPEQPVF